MRGDGNGWVECADGHRHWGRHGAAGLLLYTVDDAGRARVLMQHRAEWTHNGGTWGIPGGARDSHEDACAAALREAREETAIDTGQVVVAEVQREDHRTWAYDTVVAHTRYPLPTVPNDESAELRWLAVPEVSTLDLHPGFARSWPSVTATPTRLVVDVANVVGTQPFRYDEHGWWRDRVGATRSALAELAGLRSQVTRSGSGELIVICEVVAVVEGSARPAASTRLDGLRVVAAPGSGDDTVVSTTLEPAPHSATSVVTSDRGLRARLPQKVGNESPQWLLERPGLRYGPRP
jgi:8-oxo-dGTP diphosphatase